ncbi:MAG: hypothetical protein LLF94_12795, partial [Chlamydiales bacterium]|nr:hypothetical protein [Chlamydiales bacterium]
FCCYFAIHNIPEKGFCSVKILDFLISRFFNYSLRKFEPFASFAKGSLSYSFLKPVKKKTE